MTLKSIEDIFNHDLSDIYDAEKQITRALPKMARAATSEALVSAFELHLQETEGHLERLDQLFDATPETRRHRVKCHALAGLVEEAQEMIDSTEAGPARDAGLIGAAQKVEHYEIATYGTLRAMALKLGYSQAADLLAATLAEEKSTDKKLTAIAEES